MYNTFDYGVTCKNDDHTKFEVVKNFTSSNPAVNEFIAENSNREVALVRYTKFDRQLLVIYTNTEHTADGGYTETSTVQKVEKNEDGTVVFYTRNSTYSFIPTGEYVSAPVVEKEEEELEFPFGFGFPDEEALV